MASNLVVVTFQQIVCIYRVCFMKECVEVYYASLCFIVSKLSKNAYVYVFCMLTLTCVYAASPCLAIFIVYCMCIILGVYVYTVCSLYLVYLHKLFIYFISMNSIYLFVTYRCCYASQAATTAATTTTTTTATSTAATAAATTATPTTAAEQ